MHFDVGEREIQMSIMFVGGVAVLLFSSVGSTLITTPLAISQDNHDDIFSVATFFQRTPENKRWFVTDVLFTNMIVRVLIVMCWWSLWSLEGSFLIPNLIGRRVCRFYFQKIFLNSFCNKPFHSANRIQFMSIVNFLFKNS